MTKRKRPFPSDRPGSRPAGDTRGPGRNSSQNRDLADPDMGTAPPPAKGSAGQGPAYWLYGFHAVQAALDNPRRLLRRLLVTAEAASSIRINTDKPARPETVDRTALDRALPAGAVHQGVAALAEPLEEPDLDTVLDGLKDGQPATILLLDQVTDPQNVGAVLRSAAAFGAAAVIVPRHHAPPVTGVLAKAASGALEHVDLVRVGNLVQALERMAESGFWSVALEGEAKDELAGIDLGGRIVLALGAEGAGLRRLTRERCDHAARLPTGGPIAHLNVSNAAAVALYECARQRVAKSKGGKKP